MDSSDDLLSNGGTLSLLHKRTYGNGKRQGIRDRIHRTGDGHCDWYISVRGIQQCHDLGGDTAGDRVYWVDQ